MKRLLSILFIVLLLPATLNATVATSTGRIQQSCNGILTDYSFTFNAGDTTEVAVIVADGDGVETVLTPTTHYTTSCTNDDCSAGGTVSLGAASTCPSGSTITIIRDTDLTQTSDFTEGMPALYETFETELDKQIRVDQQAQEQIDRTLRLSSASFSEDVSVDLEIKESIADRTDKYVRFDSDGDVEMVGITAAAVLDEDDMASNSPSEAASQQSIVAYLGGDTALASPGVIGGTTPNLITGTTITATVGFVGDLTGNVTGNLTGNVTGNVTGNADTVTNGVYTTDNLSVLSATTSAQLAGVISDETGNGLAVFGTSPTLTTVTLNGNIGGTSIKDEDNMASDSADHLATQQSIKKYVDDSVGAASSTGSETFTSSGTFNVPSGINRVFVSMIGGGGGGGGGINGTDDGGGSGGSAGETLIGYPHIVTPLAALTVTIGSGGAGGTTGSGGTDGANTVFDTITVSGGIGGNVGVDSTTLQAASVVADQGVGYSGGSGAGGTGNGGGSGGPGNAGSNTALYAGGTGGSATGGSGGGGGGGASMFGVGGNGGNGGVNGSAAGANTGAGGGAGGGTSGDGGAGGSGKVIIYY